MRFTGERTLIQYHEMKRRDLKLLLVIWRGYQHGRGKEGHTVLLRQTFGKCIETLKALTLIQFQKAPSNLRVLKRDREGGREREEEREREKFYGLGFRI